MGFGNVFENERTSAVLRPAAPLNQNLLIPRDSVCLRMCVRVAPVRLHFCVDIIKCSLRNNERDLRATEHRARRDVNRAMRADDCECYDREKDNISIKREVRFCLD